MGHVLQAALSRDATLFEYNESSRGYFVNAHELYFTAHGAQGTPVQGYWYSRLVHTISPVASRAGMSSTLALPSKSRAGLSDSVLWKRCPRLRTHEQAASYHARMRIWSAP
jgi:hypothetical protein